MLIPKRFQKPNSNYSHTFVKISYNFGSFVKKLLLGGHDENSEENDEGQADSLRAENRELKMEIFQMQDEVVELEKQVGHRLYL